MMQDARELNFEVGLLCSSKCWSEESEVGEKGRYGGPGRLKGVGRLTAEDTVPRWGTG